MSEKSKIAWTDHTVNGWWGCVEVKPECAHCYAKTLAERYKRAQWGKDTPRYFVKSWRKTIDDIAKKAVGRERVFIESMGDIGERNQSLDYVRNELICLPLKHPGLDFIYLTKRPEYLREYMGAIYGDCYPFNAWVGVTCGHPLSFGNVNVLRNIPAQVKWISIEPLLAPLDDLDLSGIDWVVVGGESGKKARPMDWRWVHRLKHNAREAGAAFFFKQTGAVRARELGLKNKAGEDFGEYPATLDWLKVREFPKAKGVTQ